ncbi:MAG: 4-phosphoerythronate dehydrogenase [Paraprevotella sp.]|nr:4-phosphoerythronate dehydrogenase [Paraprevotella sp.]
MTNPKIVIDDKIPYIKETISKLTNRAVYIPGNMIGNDDIRDADALIIRTRTHCDAQLLKGSNVKFVATATIGYDHIDTNFMEQAGIKWINCPGCNASSVAQYIDAVLTLIKTEKHIDIQKQTIGIVGCGHVGRKVVEVARRKGMNILICDPPRSDAEGEKGFVSMEQIAKEADIITFHVPLTKEGRYPTYHLANETLFDSLSKKPIIINSSRGAVVDNEALLYAINYNKVQDAVIDTWENEPNINKELLKRVWIGTPHIAGYSADGKTNADNMVISALCDFFSLPKQPAICPPEIPNADLCPKNEDERTLFFYNPIPESNKLKLEPEKFEWFRNNYPLRREYI